ncbi:MAG: carbon-nitrogen hydrolase family protein [Deltaproteobacteria bacterium]|nr:carbon-nitrogen hydrolase family protein [Deltaproteobacteria bacterium]
MLIAAAQLSLTPDLAANEREILAWARRAAELGVGIMNFPEASLTGYLFEGFLAVDLSAVERSLERLHQAARELGVSLIVGAPQRPEKTGPLYNSAVVLLGDGRRLAYHKTHLVNAEKAWFAPGTEPLVFELAGQRMGVLICRDQSHPALAACLAARGARVLFLCSAHYYPLAEARLKKLKNLALPVARAVENQVYVCKANAVGWHRGLVNLGGSVIVDPHGIVVQEAGENQPEMLLCQVDLAAPPLWSA